MISRIWLFIKYYLFWLAFFAAARFLFLVYNFHFTRELPVSEILLGFVYGLRMDLSFGAYIMLFAGLTFTLLGMASTQWILKVLNPIMLVFLFFASLIVLADCELYRNWGFRMDATPLLYLKTPKEALASTPGWLLAVFLLIIILFYTFWVYIFRKTFKHSGLKDKPVWFNFPLYGFLTCCLIIPLRGGIGIAPIHTGSVYFSRNHFANHAAINVLWHVGYSLTKLGEYKQDIHLLDQNKATELFKKSVSWNPAQKRILKNERPNVVIIVLESFTKNIIGRSHQGHELTPGFNQLIREGIYFDCFYASGDRSDKGLVAILSGYPAQPQSSVIRFPEKTQKLPYISQDLKKTGYHTSFYYGGDIEFANMKSYFIHGGFDLIVHKEDFKGLELNSKWGAHDHVVFGRLFQDIKTSNGKFLKVIFTLSSHEPYEVPMPKRFKGNSEETGFFNSAYYTDSCLFYFINQCKTLKSWENTLFVLVADHGNRHPGNLVFYSSEKFQIPLLFVGGALQCHDTVIHSTCCQTDIAANILSQMNLNHSKYLFSQGIFDDKTNKTAFYCFNNGFGTIRGNEKAIFDLTTEKPISGNSNDSATLVGKAFYQEMMQNFKKL